MIALLLLLAQDFTAVDVWIESPRPLAFIAGSCCQAYSNRFNHDPTTMDHRGLLCSPLRGDADRIRFRYYDVA